mmetsp:Transcript_13530/g.39180  ORF Transcript_13530/g.39180 Transcript_13530/m.39180 type:complete len:206 (+) Transcript_13530:203-820(+)
MVETGPGSNRHKHMQAHSPAILGRLNTQDGFELRSLCGSTLDANLVTLHSPCLAKEVGFAPNSFRSPAWDQHSMKRGNISTIRVSRQANMAKKRAHGYCHRFCFCMWGSTCRLTTQAAAALRQECHRRQTDEEASAPHDKQLVRRSGRAAWCWTIWRAVMDDGPTNSPFRGYDLHTQRRSCTPSVRRGRCCDGQRQLETRRPAPF